MAINQGGINVTVKKRSPISVNLQDKRISASGNTQPTTIKSAARTLNYVRDIADVIENSPQSGFTLVYNASTNKYEVRQLFASELNIALIDGGTF